MNQPKKTNENNGGWKGNRTATDQKYLAFNLLIEQGISITKSAEMMGYKPSYGYNLAKKLRDRGQILTIVSEQNTRTAHRVVKRLMAAKTWGSMKEVKDSTVLRAAEVVLDRAEPKAGEERGGPNLSFINNTINLNLARPGHPECIDITESPSVDEDFASITPAMEVEPDDAA